MSGYGGAYGYAGYYNDQVQLLYNNLIAHSSLVNSPFSDYFNTSVASSDAPQGLFGMAFNFITSKMLGTKQPPFRLQNPFERPAGDLGAFGLSRFAGNTARMAAGGSIINSQKRRAFSEIANGKFLKQTEDNPYGLIPEDVVDWVTGFVENDETGLGDMVVGAAAQLFGAGEDYGITGVRAAKFAEGLMSRNKRQALASVAYGSENWKSMIGDTVKDFTKAARSLMYENEGNSFIRKEDFMRGLDETDVSSILERVASSADAANAASNGAGSGEDLKNRLNDVGGAAIKTLEAFKDLFGSAQRAKQMLNGLTGGGFANMTSDDFNRLTNTARGMMQMGYNAGVGHETVAGMVNMAQAGVQGAMGYTPADVAGGYVNNRLVSGIANTFVAQELSNMTQEQRDALDPVERQRMVARATWKATSFAGSTASRFMTAAIAAHSTGDMSDDTYNKIVEKFRSGDRDSMAEAANMVSSAIGLSKEQIMDPAQFKVFADIVGNNQDLTDELGDLANAAQSREGTSQTEFSISQAGLSRAQNALKSMGWDNQVVVDRSNAQKVMSIRQQLKEAADNGDAVADSVLKAMSKNGMTDIEALNKFNEARGLLSNGQGDIIMTNANAAATNELNREAYASSGVGGNLAEVVKKNGATLSDDNTIRKIDLANLARSTMEVVRTLDSSDERADRIKTLLEKGDYGSLGSEISDILGQDAGLASAVMNKTVFSAKGGPENVKGSSRMSMRDLAKAITAEGGLTKDEDRYNGQTVDEFDVLKYLGLGNRAEKEGGRDSNVLASLTETLDEEEQARHEEGEAGIRNKILSESADFSNFVESADQYGLSDESVSAIRQVKSLLGDEKFKGDERGRAEEIKKSLDSVSDEDWAKLESKAALDSETGDQSLSEVLKITGSSRKDVANNGVKYTEQSRLSEKSKDIVRDVSNILGDEQYKYDVERAQALNNALKGYTDDDMAALKKELAQIEGGDAIYAAIDRAKSTTPQKTEGSFRVNGREINLEDKQLQAAVESAIHDENLQQDFGGLTYSEIFDKVRTEPESEASKKFLEALGKQDGFVQLANELGDDKKTSLNEAAGLANLSNAGFGGSMAAIDSFKASIEGLGSKATETAASIRDLGKALQKIVDSGENKNQALAQAFAAWLKDPSAENTEKVLSSAFNGNFDDKQKGDLMQRLQEIGTKLSEFFEKVTGSLGNIDKNTAETSEAANNSL